MVKKTAIDLDLVLLVQHVNKLCIHNLHSKRVKCCASCPFEGIITSQLPFTIPLFEQKRQMIMKSGGNNK